MHQRVVELSLRSATLSGVGLAGAEKERFNQLKLRAAELVRLRLLPAAKVMHGVDVKDALS